jgi:hypothetical protein
MDDARNKPVIRQKQMETLSQAAVKDFENRMVIHLNKFFPEQCEALGEPKTREAIQYGIKRAAIYEIETERDVCKYIDLMFAFGRDFDIDPGLPWAARILQDAKYKNPTTKVEDLHQTAVWHARQAGGISDQVEN